MPNFLQKFFPPAPPAPGRRANVPAPYTIRKPGSPAQGGLPNATVIYSIAASALFVVAVYSLLTGAWFNALLILVVAGCLMGYAIYFLRNH